jgi:polyhydroxyalkanoate synthesis regulator phasin
MQDILKKTVQLGLGLGASGKEEIEKLVNELHDRVGLTKKDSRAFVKDMITKGESIQKVMEKNIDDVVNDATSRIYPVSKREFDELKKEVDGLKKNKKKATRKKATRKKAGRRTKKKTVSKSASEEQSS